MLNSVAAVESSGHVASEVEATEKHVGVTRATYFLKTTVIEQKAMGSKRAVEIPSDDTLSSSGLPNVA